MTVRKVRRERNWQRKYKDAMFSTEELRRLHRAIVVLDKPLLDSVANRFAPTGPEKLLADRAARNAVEILGIDTAHDVMFLAHYAAAPPEEAAWKALARTALAVTALPRGLNRSDYETLVGPAVPVMPWLLELLSTNAGR